MLEKMDKQLPGQYYIKFFLGVTILSLDAPKKALAFFEEAMTLGPKAEDIASVFFYMGMCLKEVGRYKEAIAALEKAASSDPERPEVHNLMGFCFFKLGEHKKAIDCFKNVLQLNPGSGIDYANIASNYREMGELEKAVRYYRFALELDPTIDFARENLKRLEATADTRGIRVRSFQSSQAPRHVRLARQMNGGMRGGCGWRRSGLPSSVWAIVQAL